MKRWPVVQVALVCGVAALVLTGFRGLREASFAAPPDTFVANLKGSEEVPPVVTETGGIATFQFDPAFSRGKFQLTVRNGQRIQQAHIHCERRGVNGPIIIFLAGFHDRGWDVDGSWVGDVTFTNANILNTACGTNLRQIAWSMAGGGTYANVHSVAHPGGVVRGQIRDVPTP